MKAKLPVIYIIDDDQIIILLHKAQVKTQLQGMDVQAFHDAQEALETLASLNSTGQKNLIFLDINMPRMNGWQFLDQLQERVNCEDIKVIIVTSSLSKSDKDKSTQYPMVIDYWEKPMGSAQLTELRERLGEWLPKN
ncbi:response regulator [Algoriphagus winogradskyi]|jgi:CheY-like chemotaxis protein|uniref:CheY chemotaxis protein or a CheY-like REC (Receiver) domain n=1 Tax=Algoriphagus winogradskyi TaxID=237017 RepID=A0ABY1NCM6_9BACT|nr:response regulator [Algoriphagus winogradskyi]SMP05704.1 CheY chemotaxis protein or a CheY-like REC (receiver) domain [Algoriphagus winogradskyi]